MKVAFDNEILRIDLLTAYKGDKPNLKKERNFYFIS